MHVMIFKLAPSKESGVVVTGAAAVVLTSIIVVGIVGLTTEMIAAPTKIFSSDLS